MKLWVEAHENGDSSLIVEGDELRLEWFERALPLLKHFSGRFTGAHSYLDTAQGTIVLHPSQKDQEGFQIVIPLRLVRTFTIEELEEAAREIFVGSVSFQSSRPNSS